MTTIQELIKDFESLKKTKLYEHSFKSIDEFIVLAYAALEKEKQQIKDAYNQGYRDGALDNVTGEGIEDFDDADNYYNQKYQSPKV